MGCSNVKAVRVSEPKSAKPTEALQSTEPRLLGSHPNNEQPEKSAGDVQPPPTSTSSSTYPTELPPLHPPFSTVKTPPASSTTSSYPSEPPPLPPPASTVSIAGTVVSKGSKTDTAKKTVSFVPTSEMEVLLAGEFTAGQIFDVAADNDMIVDVPKVLLTDTQGQVSDVTHRISEGESDQVAQHGNILETLEEPDPVNQMDPSAPSVSELKVRAGPSPFGLCGEGGMLKCC